MFNKAERRLLGPPYFVFLKEGERFIEVKSINTQHCWMLFKKISKSDRLVILYHKHHQTDEYYYKQYEKKNVKQAVDRIKNHDKYVVNQRQGGE